MNFQTTAVYFNDNNGTVFHGTVSQGTIHKMDLIEIFINDSLYEVCAVYRIINDSMDDSVAYEGDEVGLSCLGENICRSLPTNADGFVLYDTISIKELDSHVFDSPCTFHVRDCFLIEGRGSLLDGQIIEGCLKVMDEITVPINGIDSFRCVIIGIVNNKKLVDFARAGSNVGLLIRDGETIYRDLPKNDNGVLTNSFIAQIRA